MSCEMHFHINLVLWGHTVLKRHCEISTNVGVNDTAYQEYKTPTDTKQKDRFATALFRI